MAEQTKKYAYYIKGNRQVTVSEALWLRNNGKIKPTKEAPVFFDFEDATIRSAVYPVSSSKGEIARTAHYRYYDKKSKVHILYPKQMTNAHLFFQMMFKQLKSFKVELEDKNVVQVKIKSAMMEQYVKVDNKKGIIIDVLLDIENTYPYSYKYKWNNQLAIEVKVTHAVDPIKKSILQKNNISTYEVTVPERIKKIIPETNNLLDDKEATQKKIDELTKIYGNVDKWTLYGKFISKSRPTKINEGKYKMLSSYENELEQYEKQKEQLIKEIKVYEHCKLQLSQETNDLKKKLKITNQQLLELKKSEQLVQNLLKESKQKEQLNENLRKENDELNNYIIKIENQSFFSWLKRKLKKQNKTLN
jgi:chromosome segregation ATPase